MENIYYVYVYLDPRKPGKYIYGNYKFNYEPFYIGKGKDKRITCHLFEKNSNNKLKFNKIQKIKRESKKGVIISKLKSNLLENDAFILETNLILNIGRIDLKTGPLTNLTDGGEGSSNCIFTKERCKNISNALINGGNVSGSNNPQSKKLWQYNLDGTLFRLWSYVGEYLKLTNTFGYVTIPAFNNEYNHNNDKLYEVYKGFIFSYCELSINRFNKLKYNDQKGENNSNYGKHNPDVGKKISQQTKGKYIGVDNNLSIKIHQYDIDLNLISIYDSIISAAKIIGCDAGHISYTSKFNLNAKKYKLHRGFIFLRNKINELDIPINDFSSKIESYKVHQYNLNGTLINIYESGLSASKKTNICNSSINMCCNGKRKTAGGYIWKYKNKK